MAQPTSREEFKEWCLCNKYTRWYFSIIDKAIERNWRRNTTDLYLEEHHYIPRALGGSDDSTVFLTTREHFICHALLIRMLTGSKKAKMVWALMCLKGKEKRYFNSHLYESAKKHIKHSSESKAKMSFTRISKGTCAKENNPMWGKTQELSPHFGKTQTEEHKNKRLSQIRGMVRSEESKIKMSENRPKGPSGKKWFNNGVIETFDLPENKPSNFNFGRLNRRKYNGITN